MRHVFPQSWKNFFWLLARDLEIKRIGTEIELAGPFKRTEFRNSDLLKNTLAVPSLEHAASGDVTKIDDSANAVIKTDK